MFVPVTPEKVKSPVNSALRTLQISDALISTLILSPAAFIAL